MLEVWALGRAEAGLTLEVAIGVLVISRLEFRPAVAVIAAAPSR